MSDNASGPPHKDFDSRLREARAKRTEGEAGKGSKPDQRGLGFAFRLGTELVAGIVVGVGTGLGLDYWLDTQPWFLILFFFLGAGAGMLNVYRTVTGIGHGVGYRKEGETEVSDREP